MHPSQRYMHLWQLSYCNILPHSPWPCPNHVKIAHISHFSSDSSMRCARLQEQEYLTEDMDCCRTKMFVGHHLHAKWVLLNIWVPKTVTYTQQLHHQFNVLPLIIGQDKHLEFFATSLGLSCPMQFRKQIVQGTFKILKSITYQPT